MEQEYIKGDIVMYDNRIHTIMDTLELNNYELLCMFIFGKSFLKRMGGRNSNVLIVVIIATDEKTTQL